MTAGRGGKSSARRGSNAMKSHAARGALLLACLAGWCATASAVPLAAPDPEQVGGLVRQLDSNRFPVREQADRALRQLGLGAVPLLRRHLAEPPSLEVRIRLERIVKDLTRLPWHRDLAAAFAE